LYYFLSGALLQFTLAPLFGLWLGLGVPGLIYSCLIGNLASTGLGVYIARRFFGANIDVRSLAATVVGLTVSFVPLFYFQLLHLDPTLLLVIDIAAFLTVYLTIAPLLGAITDDDVTRLSIATTGIGYFSRIFEILLEYERKVLRLKYHQKQATAAEAR
jgi:hypothetical protein